MRIKKFAWLPTEVYRCKYYRCGFKWFTWVWLDEDGCHYVKSYDLPWPKAW